MRVSRLWVIGLGFLACTYDKSDLIRSGTQGYDGAVDVQLGGQGGWTAGLDGPVGALRRRDWNGGNGRGVGQARGRRRPDRKRA